MSTSLGFQAGVSRDGSTRKPCSKTRSVPIQAPQAVNPADAQLLEDMVVTAAIVFPVTIIYSELAAMFNKRSKCHGSRTSTLKFSL